MNLWAVFVTGLLVGGLSCLAVQGGLLATLVASENYESRIKNYGRNKTLLILIFLGAKLVAYTILGMMLGLLGSFFQLSLAARAGLQILVAVFMIGTAANLLNIHPIFRYFVIQPPRFLTNLIRNQSKSKDALPAGRQVFAPAVLGAFTVFIPCGTTQAMMALAVASGTPLAGALIMFAFVLGTSPIFFALGYLATRLGGVLQTRFVKLAAAAIMLLAIFNLNNALALSGSRFTVQAVWDNVYCTVAFCNSDSRLLHDVASADTVNIDFRSTGYETDKTTIKAGSEVTLNLINQDGRGCIQAFTIPALGVQQIVPVGTTRTVKITAPSQPGILSFMCSMGMFQGRLQVI